MVNISVTIYTQLLNGVCIPTNHHWVASNLHLSIHVSDFVLFRWHLFGCIRFRGVMWIMNDNDPSTRMSALVD